jgi:hypothetical protein
MFVARIYKLNLKLVTIILCHYILKHNLDDERITFGILGSLDMVDLWSLPLLA